MKFIPGLPIMLLPFAALAQPGGQPSITATGGTTSQTAVMRATSHLTVEDFGAVGDCLTPVDDTAAFNAYSAYLRGLSGYQQYRAFNLGNGRCYYLSGSVNLTALNALNFNGNGSVMISAAVGKAALDAVQSGNSVYHDFTLIAQGAVLTGLQLGRPLSAGSGAQQNSVQNAFMDSTFSEADIYDRASESTNYINNTLVNRYNSGGSFYTVIMDGDATWQIKSDFAGTYNPSCSPSTAAVCQDPLYPYTLMSFNETRTVGGTISNYYGPAVWMSNFRGQAFDDTYVSGASQTGFTPGPAAVISFSTGAVANQLEWRVHSEPTALTADFLITGTQTSPVLNGLHYVNHIDETNGSIFVLGGSATSATIHDLNLSISQWSNAGKYVFDNGANWTVDGYAYTGASGTWNGPATILLDNAGAMTYGGTIGSGASLPSSISLSSVANAGAVSGVTITNQSTSGYLGGVAAPSCTLAAPPAGGAQASCAIATVGFSAIHTQPAVAGSPAGYAANDVVTMSDGNCTTPISFKITTVSGGVPTAIGSNSVIGSCPASEMALTSFPVSGGSGTGLSILSADMSWRMLTASVTAAGAGYTSAPSVTFAASTLGGATATGASSVSSGSFAITTNGVNALNATSTATTLQAPGTNPIVAASALVMGATKFTTTGCSISATAGSGTSGTYTSGTSGTCTAVITLNGATGMTTQNGWYCSASDWTTPADAQAQTATSATTATIAGTTASGDVIHFGCQPN